MSGDGYSSPIVGGGGVLIRDSIQSRDWMPSGGTTGWAIFASGMAYFLSVVIRGSLSSANYVPGVSGYYMDGTTGAAEFNSLTARGEFLTGAVGEPRVHIKTEALPDRPQVMLWADATDEVAGAVLENTAGVGANPPVLSLSTSTRTGDNPTTIEMRCVGDPASLLGSGSGYGEIDLGGSGIVPAIVYLPSTVHLVSEEMAGGQVGIVGTVSTASAAPVSLGSDDISWNGTYPPSGHLEITIGADIESSLAAGGFAYMGFEIRDTDEFGPVRWAAANIWSLMHEGDDRAASSRTVRAGPLPTTGSYFVRAMYSHQGAAGTATFRGRTMMVKPSV